MLYRSVLDAVSRLEACGLRREAANIRADATEAYSAAWNPAALQRLTRLRDRADKVLLGRKAQPRRKVDVQKLERRTDLERTTV